MNKRADEQALGELVRILPVQKKALEKLGIYSVRDLLYYFPVRYSDISEITTISRSAEGESVTLFGKIHHLETKKGFRSGRPMATALLTDIEGTTLPITWINQAYLAKMFQENDTVKLTGKITLGKKGLHLMNPEIEKTPTLPIDLSDSLFMHDQSESFGYPIYRETRGLTSKWIYHTIQKIFSQKIHETLSDPIPPEILKKYHLPSLATALVWIHAPKKQADALAARKRFSFEEIFIIQLGRQQERAQYQSHLSPALSIERDLIDDFIGRFPFTPTDAQMQAIDTVLQDLAQEKPMSRLIEGDVGSGKTFVAATIAYAVIKNRPFDKTLGRTKKVGNIQVAYMAPTEVLATQLFENFIEYFRHTGIQIALITGSGCRKFPTKVASAQTPWTDISRTQLLKWVANGEIAIVIGTHALIQKTVAFDDLGLVIIDEQHRFGTKQRGKLAKKISHNGRSMPHFLSMTATPIPRTLALTIYGDLDLTVIDSMPAGRKPIITTIVPPDHREEAYHSIAQELAQGRQVYIICPRIDEPDPLQEKALQAKSVMQEAKRLQKNVFPHFRIATLHSKMTPKKKEEVMEAFSCHDIDILVSTSVIEVGVNVPNATVIVIEGAERFGLAQLHQLRGRVIRGNHQAYCYLFPDIKSDKTKERLQAFVTAKNGFELAELDLAQRGTGDLAGIKQWGISDIGMEAIKNIKMVEAARTEAQRLIADDRELTDYPLLQERTAGLSLQHFE
jgi:ATP-dependent DNA helicase RecG